MAFSMIALLLGCLTYTHYEVESKDLVMVSSPLRTTIAWGGNHFPAACRCSMVDATNDSAAQLYKPIANSRYKRPNLGIVPRNHG